MKKVLSIMTFAIVASGAYSQDLLNDVSRVTYAQYVVSQNVIFSTPSPAFLVGNLDFELQVLRQITPFSPTTTLSDGIATVINDNLFESTIPPAISGVWWNLGSTSLSASGLTLPPQSVVLGSADKIPAVQLDAVTGIHTVTVKATPLLGSSTPGSLVFLTYSNGAWSTVYSHVMSSGTFTDSRTVDYVDKTRMRWVLIRSGSAPAVITLSVHVE